MTYPFFSGPQTGLCAFFLAHRCGSNRAARCALVLLASTASALAAEPADLALGRHLAGECTPCHANTSSSAIPSIAGRSTAWMIVSLNAMASGKRTDGEPANPAMVSVAQSLDDAQKTALAAYFASLPGP